MNTNGDTDKSIPKLCAGGDAIFTFVRLRGCWMKKGQRVSAMAGLEFAEVARVLSCADFARREMQVQGKRAQCPFHNGRNYNLAFFDDGRCHCFKCGRTADVVQLAAAVWSTSQLDAARMLNDEFRLGLTDSTPTDEQRQRRQRERDRREEERREQREAWAKACEAEQAAQAAIERFTVDDADKPEFSQALTRLCAAQTAADAMWAEMVIGG